MRNRLCCLVNTAGTCYECDKPYCGDCGVPHTITWTCHSGPLAPTTDYGTNYYCPECDAKE